MEKTSNLAANLVKQHRTRLTWGKFVMWILSTSVTMILIWFLFVLSYLSNLVEFFTGLLLGLQALLSAIIGLLLGLLVGTWQWSILRSYVRWAPRWIWATAVGWAISGGVLWFEYYLLGGTSFRVALEDIPVALFATGAIGGSLIGLCQWLVLGRLDLSAWWVIISGLGWSIGSVVGNVATTIIDFGPFTYLMLMILSGCGTGIMTGLALLRLSSDQLKV